MQRQWLEALEGLLKRNFFFIKTKLEIIKCLKKGGAIDTVLSKYFEVGKATISDSEENEDNFRFHND